jgi:hypothetical protein
MSITPALECAELSVQDTNEGRQAAVTRRRWTMQCYTMYMFDRQARAATGVVFPPLALPSCLSAHTKP